MLNNKWSTFIEIKCHISNLAWLNKWLRRTTSISVLSEPAFHQSNKRTRLQFLIRARHYNRNPPNGIAGLCVICTHPLPPAPLIHNANLSLSEQKTSSGKTLTRAARGKMHHGYKLCLVTQASLPLSSRHSKNFILIIISPFFISCNHTSALFVPPIPQMNSTKALSLR